MYEVWWTSKGEGAPTEANGWEPHEGDGVQCRKREAMRRYDSLLQLGRSGIDIDGAVPHCVEIRNQDGVLMLGCTAGKVEVGSDDPDEPIGKWAKRAAA